MFISSAPACSLIRRPLTLSGTRANLNYLDQLAKFHKQHGTNLNRFPSVDKRPLDLYKLKKAVEVRGGFDQVCKQKKWAEIGRDLGYSGKIMSSLSTSLKNSYQRWLQPYEEYLRVAKPSVQQQLELENGGPYTPSSNQSPAAKRHLSATSSNPRESSSLDASTESESTPDRQSPVKEQSTEPTASGFTPVNAQTSGFTPVNRSPRTRDPPVKRENDDGPDVKQNGTPVANGNGDSSLKRSIRHDSQSSSQQTDAPDSEQSGRRSKRLRKGKCSTQCLRLCYVDFCL